VNLLAPILVFFQRSSEF